jgi:hypothetical protein
MSLTEEIDFKNPILNNEILRDFKMYKHKTSKMIKSRKNTKPDPRSINSSADKELTVKYLNLSKDLNVSKGLDISKDSVISEDSKSSSDQSLNSSFDSGTEMEDRSDDLEPELRSPKKNKQKILEEQSCGLINSKNNCPNKNLVEIDTSIPDEAKKFLKYPKINTNLAATNAVLETGVPSTKLDPNSTLKSLTKASDKVSSLTTCKICGKEFQTKVGLKVKIRQSTTLFSWGRC